ncbi:hypothetical protein ACX80U_12145 [Arthrobacter sp. TmT3-37]
MDPLIITLTLLGSALSLIGIVWGSPQRGMPLHLDDDGTPFFKPEEHPQNISWWQNYKGIVANILGLVLVVVAALAPIILE